MHTIWYWMDSDLAKPGYEGAKYVCSPALRTEEHRDALWEAVDQQMAQRNTVRASCGFDYAEQKHLGYGEGKSFADIPNGAPSLQNRLNILWTLRASVKENFLLADW